MYTLDQLENRIIWIFREPRSGSTWFRLALKQAIKRNLNSFPVTTAPIIEKKLFYMDRIQQHEDKRMLLDTHDFCALESMCNYENPILIRNVRKNKTEQFISGIIANITNIWNIGPKMKLDTDILPKIEPRSIPFNEITQFVARKKEIENLWDTYASQYENETVYYEDLLENWESTIFPIKLSMKETADLKDFTKKISYDKKEIIINYDEIDSILKNEFGPY